MIVEASIVGQPRWRKKRSGLLFLIAVAMASLFIAYTVGTARARSFRILEFVKRVKSLGGDVSFSTMPDVAKRTAFLQSWTNHVFGQHAFSRMSAVYLKGEKFNDRFLEEEVSNFKSIKGVSFESTAITHVGMEFLAKESEVDSILIGGSIRDKGVFDSIGSFKLLKAIEFFNTGIAAKELSFLIARDHIKAVSFFREEIDCGELTSIVRQRKSSIYIGLIYSKLIGSVSELGNVEQLNALEISYASNLEQEDIEALLDSRYISRFGLKGYQISNVLFQSIKPRGIDELWLESDLISNESVVHILGWPNIAKLHAKSKSIDCELLTKLSAVPNLELLEITVEAACIDSPSAARFQRLNPNCKLVLLNKRR